MSARREDFWSISLVLHAYYLTRVVYLNMRQRSLKLNGALVNPDVLFHSHHQTEIDPSLYVSSSVLTSESSYGQEVRGYESESKTHHSHSKPPFASLVAPCTTFIIPGNVSDNPRGADSRPIFLAATPPISLMHRQRGGVYMPW